MTGPFQNYANLCWREERSEQMIVRSNGCRLIGVGVAALAVTLGMQGPAQGQSRTRRVNTVTSGTVIPVKLDEAISSKDAQKGDTFTATVENVGSYSATSLPVGTKVEGVVRSAQPKDGKNPGTLDLAFDRVTLPNGRSYAISGSPIGLDNKSVSRQNGRLVAKGGSKGPNRLTYVGIGAGAGLLVNILGHRKGTLTDVLIGAGLGYGAGALIKNGSGARDVDLKAGSSLGVTLNRSLALAR
jgi:hypothetical protein